MDVRGRGAACQVDGQLSARHGAAPRRCVTIACKKPGRNIQVWSEYTRFILEWRAMACAVSEIPCTRGDHQAFE